MKIRRVLYLSATVLELLCLAGIYAVQYFTRRKMGMARFVVYKSRDWESRYPMELLANLTVIFLVVLAASVFLFFVRRHKKVPRIVWWMNVVMLFLTVVYTGFIWRNAAVSLRAYYFIGGILAIMCLIQTIKTVVGILMCNYET